MKVVDFKNLTACIIEYYEQYDKYESARFQKLTACIIEYYEQFDKYESDRIQKFIHKYSVDGTYLISANS